MTQTPVNCNIPRTIHQYKVATLPANPEPNSLYYVKGVNDTVVVAYITDKEGNPTPIVSQIPVTVDDKNFVHTQTESDLEFTVTHGLNKLVSVTMVDNTGNLCEADFDYDPTDELNKVRFHLNSYFYGRIIFN